MSIQENQQDDFLISSQAIGQKTSSSQCLHARQLTLCLWDGSEIETLFLHKPNIRKMNPNPIFIFFPSVFIFEMKKKKHF